MGVWKRLSIVVPAVVLVALLALLWVNRGTMAELGFLSKGPAGEAGQAGPAGQVGLVDQRPFQTAQTLAGLTVSAEEQRYAQEAERLADHEVDQRFATALREASLQQRVLTGEAARTAVRVDELKKLVADDKTKLEAAVKQAAASGVTASEGDDVDVAKAQLGLDTDELTDATADLARESGDQRGEIQSELAAYAALTKSYDEGKQMAVVSARQYGSLWARGNAWLEQRTRVELLKQAQASAASGAKAVAAEHDALERKGEGMQAGMGAETGSARVKTLQTMSSMRVVMSISDDRESTDGQLAEVYGRWQSQVWMQHRIMRYMIVQSLAWVVLLVLAAAVMVTLAKMLIGRAVKEARRASTLDRIVTLGVEVAAGMGVLLILFGVPEHVTTMLGLAGAGLTVVFQDFILAFFGWFVLMGRNGIRVCDWVEIDGVGGEVSEIGLLRTTLLETGNWTSRGHPTGRKVTFSNSFAIRGQFFNFTTHGQWMWDEMKLSVASGMEAYELLKKVQEAVEAEGAEDRAEAEEEWRHAAGSVALGHFGAGSTVDLRPAGSGMEIVVRFMTRATERFERRNKLYEMLLKLLREGEEAKALPAGGEVAEGAGR